MELGRDSQSENQQWHVIEQATSADGRTVRFCRQLDEAGVLAGEVHVCYTNELYVSISEDDITHVGDGDSETGLTRLVTAVSTLEYGNARLGGLDPLYDAVIFPAFGGFGAYSASKGYPPAP